MATSGALSGFLQAMLQLRAQRLQEEEAKQRSSQAGMSALMSGITGAASSIMGGITKGAENASANKLMGEYFGGGGGPTVGDFSSTGAGAGAAQSLGRLSTDAGAAPSDFTLPTTQTANRFTGGQAELENRMKLEQLRQTIGNAKANDLYKQAQLGIAAGHLAARQDEATRAVRTAELKARNDAYEGMTDKAKDIYNDTSGYIKSSAGFLDDARKAMNANDGQGDPAAYQAAVEELTKLNAVHQGRKLTTPAVEIPPYLTPAMKESLQTGGAAQQLFATQQAGVTPQPRHPVLPTELVNRVAGGVQPTQQEAQQLGMQLPTGAGAPAPGARPLTAGNGKYIWNYQTGKWDATGK